MSKSSILLLFHWTMILMFIYGGLSQYLFPLKTKLGLNWNRQWILSEQFVNEQLMHFRLSRWPFEVSADKNLGRRILLNYNSNFTWLHMKFVEKEDHLVLPIKSFLMNQKLKAGLNILKKIYLETIGAYRVNHRSEFDNTVFFSWT